MPSSEFYDKLARFYHLIFENWDDSIERQATALDSIIRGTALKTATWHVKECLL